MKQISQEPPPLVSSHPIIDILSELDLYRIDFAKLSDFFSKSDLARKLNGFIQSQNK